MQLTIITPEAKIFNLEVIPETELEHIKAMCEFESGIPSSEIQLSWNGQLLDVKKTLSAYGVSNGEVLKLQRIQGTSELKQARESPTPNLPEIDFGSMKMPEKRNAKQSDPNVEEGIQEVIELHRMNGVNENYAAAMEHAPESFAKVLMLYIDCKVNGHPVKAFVDSGAQQTMMSQRCAERCDTMRLVDKRWAGTARGVGTQRIIGRIHLCPIQIQGDFFSTSFDVLKEMDMDILLGLDMLKRHQCTLDFKNNKLIIGTTGTETPFLGEADAPENARLNRPESDASQEEMETDDGQQAERTEKSASEASGVPSQPSSTTPSLPEADILTLISQGFSRQQATDELTKANGNVDQALAALLAKAFTFP